mmetsp:Transcript_10216/g.30331  ORF Transcript_10216/g.30331 Transcript_10216/m.30331 type:complete len:377 (-) Transcript_10216:102-1232(-)
MARVHGDEGFTNLRPLLVRERPGHHGHAGPPELRGLGKVLERADYVGVHLGPVLAGLLEELVLQGLLGRQPVHRVHRQQGPHKVLRRRGHLRPLVGLVHPPPGLDGEDLLLLVSEEWHVAADQDESDHSHAPEVALAGVAPVEDLGSDVVECSAAELHLRVGLPDVAEAEVDELEVVAVLLLVEEVLQLEVPVDDALGVKVVHSEEHLSQRDDRIGLGEALPCPHALEKLAALHALHDEVEPGGALVDIDEASHVRVIHAQEDLALALELAHLLLADAGEVETLHRVHSAGVFVGRPEHGAVVPGAQDLGLDGVVILELHREAPVATRDRVLAHARFRTGERGVQPLLAVGPAHGCRVQAAETPADSGTSCKAGMR